VDQQETINEVFVSMSHMLVREKSYPTPLPEEIRGWYFYVLDCGHSVLCLLSADWDIALSAPSDYLTPIPVKTVLRGYRMQEGFVIVDVPYDPELGALPDEADSEY